MRLNFPQKDGNSVEPRYIISRLNLSERVVLKGIEYVVSKITLDLDLDSKGKQYSHNLIAELEQISPKFFPLSELMFKVYGPSFYTGGANTNEIDNNPRLIGLIICMTAFIDINWIKSNPDFVPKCSTLVKSKWNNKNIGWSELDFDDIPAYDYSIDEIKVNLYRLAKEYKLSQDIWPIFKTCI